jgi:diguanylate cyclase (GGDEF)-like protein/PAS domain S-box-containing protein
MFASPERSLTALIEFSPLAILELDREGRIKLWNPAAERMFGWAQSEVLGRVNPIIPLETQAEYEDDVPCLFAGSTIQGKDVHLQHKDGRRLHVRLWASPVYNGQSEVVGISAILEDITDQKQNERKLRASQAHENDMEADLQRGEERMRLAFDAAKVGFWDWDIVTGKIVWSAFEGRQLALSEDSPGSFKIFMNAVHPDDRKAVQESIEAAVQGHKDHIMEYRVLWPDGSLHWRFAIGRVFRDSTGCPARMVGIAMDIDDRKAAEERLQLQATALQAAANAIVITDSKGAILWSNPAFSQLTGYASEEVLGKNPRLLKSGEQDSAFYANLWATITSGKTWHGEIVNRRKDETVYTEEMTITPVRTGGCETTHYVAIKQDITSRKIAEKALRQAEQKYRDIFDDAIIGIFQVTPEGRPVSINRAMARLHGYDSPELLFAEVSNVGQQLFVDPNALQEVGRRLEKERALHNIDLELYCKDGKNRWVSASVRAVTDADGKVVLHEGTVEDITVRKAAQEQVQFLAYYDVLTGLPNRTLLRDRILMALLNARQRKEKVALLFLDLDRFKIINDSLGHSTGDLLLKQVAQRLKEWTHEQDTVAHMGGDEFLVLLTGINKIADAVAVAERVVKLMASEFVIPTHSLNITCSLGISIFPDHGGDAETLIRYADQAMYSAKENGRNNFQLFRPGMSVEAAARMTLESSLRLAVAKREFFLEYQPQLDLATGQITGCEALIRWRHPELGVILPGKFIPLAESSGLIGPIGEWVLKTACAQARQWQGEGLSVPVAVNVSAIQFRQEGFVELIKTVLHETGLAPESLDLELTESTLLTDAEIMRSILQQLRAMGLKLTIDDFGTGYSSFNYLKHFQVHKLKIDRSFVRDMMISQGDAAIAITIIVMAKSLGLRVLAEGVENEEQVSFLRSHNCDEIQGNYFSQPLPAAEFADKLRGLSHKSDAGLATGHR